METKNNPNWNNAHESAYSTGQQGITKALELTTNGIADVGARVSGQIIHLSSAVETLNKNINKFNESSSDLANKAYKLSFWVMWATIVSATATFITAVIIAVNFFTS